MKQSILILIIVLSISVCWWAYLQNVKLSHLNDLKQRDKIITQLKQDNTKYKLILTDLANLTTDDKHDQVMHIFKMNQSNVKIFKK